jgi:hypothetical protein
MTLYTCIRKKDKNFYECIQGFHDYPESDILDYKIISLPSSNLTFQICKEYYDYTRIKYSLPKDYRNNLIFHYSNCPF